jgi:ABC-type sugar transport system ATPase subunit
MRAYLEIFNVSKSFGSYTVLKDINLLINRGEFISLIGHSGCGKSTLLSIVAGLTEPTTGSVIWMVRRWSLQDPTGRWSFKTTASCLG